MLVSVTRCAVLYWCWAYGTIWQNEIREKPSYHLIYAPSEWEFEGHFEGHELSAGSGSKSKEVIERGTRFVGHAREGGGLWAHRFSGTMAFTPIRPT